MFNYRVIVFDLGNVLIPFDYTPFFNEMNKIKTGMGDRLKELYKENYHIHREFEAGILTRSDFIKQVNIWTEGLLEEEYFCTVFSDIFTVNEDVVSLLPVLKEKYKLCILSNTNPIHMKYGWLKYDFLKYFDHLCLSHEAGAIKPQEKIYRAAEKLTGMQPNEHIFIDDIYDYAEGAKRAGWDGINFTGYDNLVAEFKKRGIL